MQPTLPPERLNDLHEANGRSHSVNANMNIPLEVLILQNTKLVTSMLTLLTSTGEGFGLDT
jgi:hypothetical protein